MAHPETDQPADAEPARRRDLVVVAGGASSGASGPRPVPERPLAGFLAQLIVSVEPTLRPSRGERTRAAAARYAETARRA